jgi:hypothetical protein
MVLAKEGTCPGDLMIISMHRIVEARKRNGVQAFIPGIF